MMFYCPELEGGGDTAIINGLMEAQQYSKASYNKPSGLWKRLFDGYSKKRLEYSMYGNEYLLNYLKTITPEFASQSIAAWATELEISITNNTGDTTRTYQFTGNRALEFQCGFWYTVYAEDGVHLFRPTITGVSRGVLQKAAVIGYNRKVQTSVHFAGETGYDYTIRPATDIIIPDLLNSVMKTLALQKYRSNRMTFSSGTDMDAGDYVTWDAIRWIVLSKKYDTINRVYQYQAISEQTETYSFSAADETPVTYLDTSANAQTLAAGKKIGIGVTPDEALHIKGASDAGNIELETNGTRYVNFTETGFNDAFGILASMIGTGNANYLALTSTTAGAIPPAASLRVIMRMDGFTGINVALADIEGVLHVSAAAFADSFIAERTLSSTNAAAGTARVLATSSGDMADGFGTGIIFCIRDTADVINLIAGIYAVRSGADNSGDLVFYTYTTGTGTAKFRMTKDGWLRAETAVYRRYYHVPIDSINPGASGATLVVPSANTVGGWQINAATELLYGDVDIHQDWDGASDMRCEVTFEVNVDNTGGAAGDTVDLKLILYYKADGATACRTQTVEVAKTVGASARYKQFDTAFTIDWDAASNIILKGDKVGFSLNIETDTGEVDDIIVTSMSFSYNSTHVGIESGDI